VTELERCDAEISQIEHLLRSGHLDMEGLLLALADWRVERRLVMEAAEDIGDGETRNNSENRLSGTGATLRDAVHG
jgi:hypothetical protein